ncbi:hypothetical protein SELMODRAFT_89846 [Selaginella moellendorffii]|uniref:Phospholipase A1 n=1 Tax=Selaginella moellendorffii TaxID=88036 RepID=D8RAM1_SELML|nr:phospholipase A1-Igamma1, chloroplastic [Selaginella moellendorffii]EFJ30344.1 hypothetical protein SELMODRAFT_89846 [Selaginella moellendorffii]|eukprot:XP_002968090.1 phospholipase A1-Igamma1, chloroplastic [Selaginella moellendorffii]
MANRLASSLASKWKLVQGQTFWKGMLGNPMDETLCQELIRYGQLIQCVVDGFNEVKASRWYGLCIHGKSQLFHKLQMGNTGYTIHKYIYGSTRDRPRLITGTGTTREPHTGWSGYLAMSNDQESLRLGRRDILLAFRGMELTREWSEIDSLLPLPRLYPAKPAVAAGSSSPVLVSDHVASLYTHCYPGEEFGSTCVRDQIVSTLRGLIDANRDEELSITVAGHSLGGALATLCAYDIVNESVNAAPNGKMIPVTAFVIGGPQVGNYAFKVAAEGLQSLRVLTVVNPLDVVTKLPGNALGYVSHIGVLLEVVHTGLAYLKHKPEDLAVHDLQLYLHLIGNKVEPFKYHQLELLNKSADLLANPIVPPKWWYVRGVDVIVSVDEETGKLCFKLTNVSPSDPEYS